MSRIAYVNGRYLPFRDATVHVEDRGYQFADSVYDVCEVRGGRLVDERRHIGRLKRSLDELRMRMPMSVAALGVVLREVIARNRIGYGNVYLQVSRGVARRDHAFPSPEVPPSLVVTARPHNRARNEALAAKGIAVISVSENRWGRVDIKTTSLLPNVLARQAAIEQGARDAWFVDASGLVTEGASTNAWIVTADGTLVTRPADHAILRGITRHRPLRRDQGARACARRTTLQPQGGLYRTRSLRYRGDTDRAAGGEDRRPHHRRRQAGTGRAGAAAGISPLRRDRVIRQTPAVILRHSRSQLR
jgi:D-alanine transaminase